MSRFLFPLILTLTSLAHAQQKDFVATPLTQPKQFTAGIEGPHCDKAGNIYAVSFGNAQTISGVAVVGVSPHTEVVKQARS